MAQPGEDVPAEVQPEAPEMQPEIQTGAMDLEMLRLQRPTWMSEEQATGGSCQPPTTSYQLLATYTLPVTLLLTASVVALLLTHTHAASHCTTYYQLLPEEQAVNEQAADAHVQPSVRPVVGRMESLDSKLARESLAQADSAGHRS